MKISESKTSAKQLLLASGGLFAVGAISHWGYGLGGTAIFTMAVAVLCALACVKKLRSDGFIEILDDGFVVRKGGKQGKFFFKDIEAIDTKTIDVKRNVQILSVNFKRGKLDLALADGLLQPIGDDEAVILNNYEKSIHELRNLLREKLNN